MTRTILCSLSSLLLALAGCSAGGNSVTPAPDLSQVMFVHSSYPQATATLQFTADNASVGQVGYGQNSGYITLTAGAHALAVNGSANTNVTLLKNQSYTLFAYSASAASVSSTLVSDDLTAPTTGMARLRLINLTANVAGGNVKVAQATTVGTTTTYKDLTSLVSSNSNSAFTDFTPITGSLVLLDASNNVLAQVGNGGGGGTGITKYQSGKLYTIIASGDNTATIADYKLKAFALNNN